MDLKGQYELLHELKSVDEKYFQLKSDLAKIPVELKKIDDSLQSKKQSFEKVRNESVDFEKSVRKFELDLKEWEDRLTKAESKMMEVKTNEEYQAAMKENQAQKTEKGKLEEKILQLMGDLEKRKSALKQSETLYKEEEKTAEGEKKELLQHQSVLQKQLEEKNEIRKNAMSKLPRETLVLYEKTVARVSGAPIVQIERGGLCPSCHITLRPQLYNEILGFKAIHKCANCNRILIVPIRNDEQNQQTRSVL